jgi:hypothetical protein
MPFLILPILFFVPGWAFLSVNHLWRHWQPLQRWCLAACLSIAFYPVFFYWVRLLFPSLRLGPHKVQFVLVLLGITIIWRLGSYWREQIDFDRWEVLGLLVMAATLFTRYWLLRDHPYPAWTDSLHHTLITHLTATGGRLPNDLQPYSPVPLGMYHLGLYSISGLVQMLAQVPAHTALLLTAQTLNGLCPVGVYLLLDRKINRHGAVIGAVIAGLVSFQPAWYVNWGRFTQLAGQTILLAAVLISWETIRNYTTAWGKNNLSILVLTGMSCFLNSAVILLHFRVAAFFISFLAILIVYEIGRAIKNKRLPYAIWGILLIGFGTMLLTIPALKEAVFIYWERTAQASSSISLKKSAYFIFPWSTILYLVAPLWLLLLGGVAGVYGFLKHRLIIGSIIWMVILLIIGSLYILDIPLLAFTNLGAVLIMLYLPLSLIIGAGGGLGAEKLASYWPKVTPKALAISILMVTILFVPIRLKATEPYRYFVTPADIKAMDWINSSIPQKTIFAINTYFWLPNFPHGTDAGYWIPYFTGHQTTTESMLFSLRQKRDREKVADLSKKVINSQTVLANLEILRQHGVEYIYIGNKGNFSGPGLQKEEIGQSSKTQLLYSQEGVSIFKIIIDRI